MEIAAACRNAPPLRLVIDNAAPLRQLMPILEVERRLWVVERTLRRPGLPAAEREALEGMRGLLRCELAARPFSPDTAHRCEHRLRWIEAAQRRHRGGQPEAGLFRRALQAMAAILPASLAGA